MNDDTPTNPNPNQVPPTQPVNTNSLASQVEPLPSTPQPITNPPSPPDNEQSNSPANPVGAAESVSSEPEAKSNHMGSTAFSAISSIFFGILNWVIIPIIIVFILHNFVFQAFHVVGQSMDPTLHDTDYLIVSKIGKSISGFKNSAYIPNRYDVVVFHYPRDPNLIFVKRVIGLPGEHVVIKDGRVRVFNKLNPQGIDPDLTTYQRATETTQGTFDDIVPEGSIFVLGDNRSPNGSFDSREWGFLPSKQIVGTAAVRLLPLDKFRLFSLVSQDLPKLVQSLL